jgi:copper chaperone NosL
VKKAACILAIGLLAGCASGAPRPAAFQAGTPCTHCRMTVLDQKLASQLVAPGEDPRFFDDLGCLTAYLAAHPAEPGVRAFVADHTSGAWIPAAEAVYSRDAALATPMNSHLVAHADASARAADPSVRGASRLSVADVFGPAGAPGGNRDR